MAEPKTEEPHVTTCSIPIQNSPDSVEDPVISDTKTIIEKKDAATYPKAKRRKNCPSALENTSFTFDTTCQTLLQFTPKFGSFNLVHPLPASCSESKQDKDEELEHNSVKYDTVKIELQK
ncbi:hypothetical protein AgCh_004911 [Apium graveolens]